MYVKIHPYSKTRDKICNALRRVGINLKERKDVIRIDKSDTWGMYNTLALVIHPMLVQLRDTKHGAPNTDDADVPEELRSTSTPAKKHDYDPDDNHFKRWDYILDEMIWAFYQHSIDWESQFYSGEPDIKFVPCEDKPGYSMMEHGPNHTFKVDRDGYAAHYKRMENGLRLFGKYYTNLWD